MCDSAAGFGLGPHRDYISAPAADEQRARIVYALGSREDVDQVAPPHQVLDVATSQVAPASRTGPMRPRRPEPPMRLIGRGSGQAEAGSGTGRGLRKRERSRPKPEPTCVAGAVSLVAPLELDIRAALGPHELADVLQRAHLHDGNQAVAARRLRRGGGGVRRERAVSCVRVIPGEGRGGGCTRVAGDSGRCRGAAGGSYRGAAGRSYRGAAGRGGGGGRGCWWWRRRRSGPGGAPG